MAKGTLKGKAAENFVYAAQKYISGIRNSVTRDIKNFVEKTLITELKKVRFSNSFFANYDKTLEVLENQINEKEITLETYRRLSAEIARIKV